MKVVFFQRKQLIGGFSLEFIFDDVRSRLTDNIDAVKYVFSKESIGILNRLSIIWECFTNQGDINHITGDIHFAGLLANKRKTILTVLDCVFMEKHKGIKRWILKKFWLDIPIKKASIVTSISEATKREIIKYTNCNPDKIIVVPVAISGKFKKVDKTFNSQKPVILHVGMAPNKNLNRLIEALEGLEIHLSIIGKLTDEYRSKLDLCKIEFSNAFGISDEEMLQKYIECDIVSFVSTYEGFGMPILEAQSIGRVVITSKVASMPEVGGNAAHYVNPFDIKDIQLGILKVLNDENYRKELISQGFENIKRFNAQYIATKYEETYKMLFDKNKISL